MIKQIYERLFLEYGPQGWWPLLDLSERYHPGDYSYPQTRNQQFEICIGAILTQNTSWKNVEKAMLRMAEEGFLQAEKILNTSTDYLAEVIHSAGYYNQKAKKLRYFAEFFLNQEQGRVPKRTELLNIWGVGPETADSILLYAYKKPSFVIDTYTKRILVKLKLVNSQVAYDEMKSFFEHNLPKDVKIYQEYHALLVEHAKRYYCGKKSVDCFLC